MNEKTIEKTKIQWQPIFELIVVLLTILGSTIPLYMHMNSRVDKFAEKTYEMNEKCNEKNFEMNEKIYQLIEAIRLDMRDFHGRLCAIEERNKAERK